MAILRVKQSKIKLKDGNVVVESPQLINELIHNSDEVIKLLSSTGVQVKLADISIDEEGRIVIDNPDFRKVAEGVLSKMTVLEAADNNGICGFSC